MLPIVSFLLILSVNCLNNVFASNPYLTKKPDWAKTCQLSDPKFTECSTEAVGKMFHMLGKGIPEIGLIPMDPLYVPEIKISQGSGAVSLEASLNNATITGLGGIKVLKNEIHPVTIDWTTNLFIPTLRIEGIYTAKGQILVVPISGKGPSWFEVGDLNVYAKCDVGLYKKKNHLFYNVTDTHVNFEIGKLKFHLANLFEGRKDLEESTNKYLNENWREVAEIIKPIIQATIEQIALRFVKQYFDNIPAEYYVSDLPEPKNKI